MSERVWRRAPFVAEVRSETSDTIAVLQLDTDQPRVLNGTAATIWALIDGHRSQSEIVAQLCEEYDDADGLISAHVENFMAILSSELLIEQIPAGIPGTIAGAGGTA